RSAGSCTPISSWTRPCRPLWANPPRLIEGANGRGGAVFEEGKTMLSQWLPVVVFVMSLTASRPSLAAMLPVRVGQEWSYHGSTRVTGEERAERSYATTVTVVGQAGGRPEVARFRQTGNTPFRPAASLAWLAPSREEEVQIPEAAGIEPGVR